MQAEKAVLKNRGGNPTRFGKAEQFFYGLCDFYRLKDCVKMWIYKMTVSTCIGSPHRICCDHYFCVWQLCEGLILKDIQTTGESDQADNSDADDRFCDLMD